MFTGITSSIENSSTENCKRDVESFFDAFHPASILIAYPVGYCRGLEPIPAVVGREVRYTPNRWLVYHRPTTQRLFMCGSASTHKLKYLTWPKSNVSPVLREWSQHQQMQLCTNRRWRRTVRHNKHRTVWCIYSEHRISHICVISLYKCSLTEASINKLEYILHWVCTLIFYVKMLTWNTEQV